MLNFWTEKCIFQQNLSKFWKINCRKFANFWKIRSREECKSCRSRKMLQNASSLATVAVDTEENEPIKNEVWWVWRHFLRASGPRCAREKDCAGVDVNEVSLRFSADSGRFGQHIGILRTRMIAFWTRTFGLGKRARRARLFGGSHPRVFFSSPFFLRSCLRFVSTSS